MSEQLVVIMPVYNEEESLPTVVRDWAVELEKLQIHWRMMLLDDGSKDRTPQVMAELAQEFNTKIIIKRHANCGHGQTCIKGYKEAIAMGADYILQIDSDGQCDPQYFKFFWQQRAEHAAIFGYRYKRGDGFTRFLISRVVSLVVFFGARVWVRDPNVPYRLFRQNSLQKILTQVPLDFYLANILVSALVAKQTKIKWINIYFRDRIGGTPSANLSSFMRHGYNLWRQLRLASRLK